MVNPLFKPAKKGCNQFTQIKRESLQFSGSPTIKPRRSIWVAPLKSLKDIEPSESWRSPWLIFTRQVGPKDPQDFNRIVVTYISSKNIVPLVIDGSNGFIRLIDYMPTSISHEIVGLILCFILEVMKEVGTIGRG